jgi:hypothetical protein
MSLLRSIRSGRRSLFRKEQVSQELDEELNGFLEMAASPRCLRRLLLTLTLCVLLFFGGDGFLLYRHATHAVPRG